MGGSTKDRKVPDAEHIPDHLLHRDRTPAGPRRGPVNWPASFRGLYTKARDGWSVPASGSVGGTPMQLGDPVRLKSLVVGRPDYGERVKVRCPKPQLGFWWTTGYPKPDYDKHATIVDPASGGVFEFIQLDPAPLIRLPWTTDANGYGLWRNGELVPGNGSRATTGTGLPRFRYLWTPFSAAEGGHMGSIVLPDYTEMSADGVRSDGLLMSGPRPRSVLVLDRGSASFRDMHALGGECRAMAEAHATYGLKVIDRNSYADIPAHERKARIGSKPHEPTIEIQPAGQWEGSNIGQYRIHLLDLLEAA